MNLSIEVLPEASSHPAGHSVLQLANYRFEWECTRGGYLPEFAGSALRGVLGHALKSAVCIARSTECASCRFTTSCPYFSIFEGAAVSAAVAGNGRDGPLPYVFRTKLQARKSRIAPGDHWSFEMTLMGPALSHLPAIISSLQSALSRNFTAEHLAFELTKVQCLDLVSGSEGLIWSKAAPFLIAHHAGVAMLPCPDARRLQIDFLNPLRVQRRRKLLGWRELTFQDIWHALHRRLHAVADCYLGGVQQLPFALTRELPEGLQSYCDFSWVELRRYSSRQNQLTPISGVIGSVQLTGNWHPLWEALYLMQWLNHGKNTAFGLGLYRISAL